MPSLASPSLAVSPVSRDPAEARAWMQERGTGRDGVMAKLTDQPYRSGQRDAMVKVKTQRTADCVVGGFRYLKARREVGSLLLGLYDDQDRLDHVGFTSTIDRQERTALTRRLEALIARPRLHRQGSRGCEPVEHGQNRRVAAAPPGTGCGSALRPRFGRPLPARHDPAAVPARQGARAVPDAADTTVSSFRLRLVMATFRGSPPSMPRSATLTRTTSETDVALTLGRTGPARPTFRLGSASSITC